MQKGSLGYAAYILALVGGILLIVFSLLDLLRFAVFMPFRSPLGGFFGAGIIGLILGAVAIVGSRRATELIGAIVLILVGYFGGGIGGLLILVGGILGLIARYI